MPVLRGAATVRTTGPVLKPTWGMTMAAVDMPAATSHCAVAREGSVRPVSGGCCGAWRHRHASASVCSGSRAHADGCQQSSVWLGTWLARRRHSRGDRAHQQPVAPLIGADPAKEWDVEGQPCVPERAGDHQRWNQIRGPAGEAGAAAGGLRAAERWEPQPPTRQRPTGGRSRAGRQPSKQAGSLTRSSPQSPPSICLGGGGGIRRA